MSGIFGEGPKKWSFDLLKSPGQTVAVYDAFGWAVPATQLKYVAMVQTINWTKHYVWATNPYYQPPATTSGAGTVSGGGAGTRTATSSTSGEIPIKFTESPQSIQYHFNFDTIGQSIYRSFGNVMTPLRMLWVQGVFSSEQTVITEVVTFAAAMSSPIDPHEDGKVGGFYLGRIKIYDPDIGFTIPIYMDEKVAALLIASIQNAIVYPGDETQTPCPLIVADRGDSKTNAFRGLRYMVLPSYPILAGFDIGIEYWRTNGGVG